MIEVIGNLWEFPADVRVITTNGTVKKNGECVMGRGCALEAKQRQPSIALALGRLIQQHGNHVFLLNNGDVKLYSFPVKHAWHEKADLALIERSAYELGDALRYDLDTPFDGVCVMPRPGCGNGGLRWADVKSILEPILDDRFHVITWPSK